MKKFALYITVISTIAGCASFDMSASHLRNTVPRFTTFSTISPQAMTTCISNGWVASGHTALTTTQTDTGYTLQSNQKLVLDHEKVPMYFVDINTSREGSSVRFYTNRANEIADRSMISIIQRCD